MPGFRGTLLGALPAVSGAGMVILLKSDGNPRVAATGADPGPDEFGTPRGDRN